MTQHEARERVLAAAEQLFDQKGYGPVTLRQIGARAGIHHSSLYHHVPGGKAELFVEVMQRIFARHQRGLIAAIGGGGPDLRSQLYAAADWMLSQPPIDLLRMERVDLAEFNPAHRQLLTDGAYSALQAPLEQALAAAAQRGEIRRVDFELLSGGLLGMLQSLHAVSEQVAGKTHQAMARGLIDLLLEGLFPR